MLECHTTHVHTYLFIYQFIAESTQNSWHISSISAAELSREMRGWLHNTHLKIRRTAA